MWMSWLEKGERIDVSAIRASRSIKIGASNFLGAYFVLVIFGLFGPARNGHDLQSCSWNMTLFCLRVLISIPLVASGIW